MIIKGKYYGFRNGKPAGADRLQPAKQYSKHSHLGTYSLNPRISSGNYHRQSPPAHNAAFLAGLRVIGDWRLKMLELVPQNDNAFVEIDGGRVFPNAAILSETSRVQNDVSGQSKFFVKLVQSDGEITLWDGDRLSEAVRNAKEIARDFDAPIINRLMRCAS